MSMTPEESSILSQEVAILLKAFYVEPDNDEIQRIQSIMDKINSEKELQSMIRLSIPDAKNFEEIKEKIDENIHKAQTSKKLEQSIVDNAKNKLDVLNANLEQSKKELSTFKRELKERFAAEVDDKNFEEILNSLLTYGPQLASNLKIKAMKNPFYIPNQDGGSTDLSSKFSSMEREKVLELQKAFNTKAYDLLKKKEQTATEKLKSNRSMERVFVVKPVSNEERRFNDSQAWLKLLREKKFSEADKLLEDGTVNVDARDVDGCGALFYLMKAYNTDPDRPIMPLAKFIMRNPSEKILLNAIDELVIQSLPNQLLASIKTDREKRKEAVQLFLKESFNEDIARVLEGKADLNSLSKEKYCSWPEFTEALDSTLNKLDSSYMTYLTYGAGALTNDDYIHGYQRLNCLERASEIKKTCVSMLKNSLLEGAPLNQELKERATRLGINNDCERIVRMVDNWKSIISKELESEKYLGQLILSEDEFNSMTASYRLEKRIKKIFYPESLMKIFVNVKELGLGKLFSDVIKKHNQEVSLSRQNTSQYKQDLQDVKPDLGSSDDEHNVQGHPSHRK